MSNAVPPLTTSTRAGTLLGDRYRFQQLIATGGMAQVWKATDEVLGRSVAVKVLHEHLADDSSFIARFKSEAVSAARLNHRNIVAIYDTVSDSGIEAIVMELIEGRTLRDLLDERGPTDVNEVVRIISDVCEALDVAHGAGVVHRDIKPSNVLLSTDGRVVVTDFGIAKAEQSLDLTQTGDVMGTAKYLAPEQVHGEDVDGRADLYSLGVVLYEAVCGRPPFDAGTQLATAIARTTTDPPAPRNIQPGCSKQLEQVILRSIRRNREKRYDSGSAFRLALTEAVAEGGVPADRDAAISAPTIDLRVPAANPAANPTANFARSERGWLIPAVALLVLSGGLILAAVFFGGTEAGRDIVRDTAGAVGIGDPDEPSESADDSIEVLGETESASDEDTTTEPPLAQIELAASFDPLGDGTEHNDKVALLSDGNPATFWRTERYATNNFGNLKTGVGAWVTLNESLDISSLEIDSPNNNWSVAIFAADGTTPPQTLDAWGEPLATVNEISAGTAVIDLDGSAADSVLIWITDLGDGATPIRMEISEIRLSGS